jgi:hypothetical protein
MVRAAGIENVGSDHIATIGGLSGLVQNVISVLIALSGLLLFIMLLWGGFSYITSGGDPKKVEGAKSTLTNAILGLMLVAVSFLILRFIQFFTGAPVTNFSVVMP